MNKMEREHDAERWVPVFGKHHAPATEGLVMEYSLLSPTFSAVLRAIRAGRIVISFRL
jgi:hypothetical protein